MSAKRFLGGDILALVELEISIIERYFGRKASHGGANLELNLANFAKSALGMEQKIVGNHDKSEAVSLIYFSLPTDEGYGEIFENILRQTDAVIKEGEHYVAILYGTDKLGASVLLAGIQEFLGAQPIDMVVSYPIDATDARTLVVKFQDEIKDNYGVVLECLKTEKYNPYEI